MWEVAPSLCLLDARRVVPRVPRVPASGHAGRGRPARGAAPSGHLRTRPADIRTGERTDVRGSWWSPASTSEPGTSPPLFDDAPETPTPRPGTAAPPVLPTAVPTPESAPR
nr:hypothetical protein GCM10017745_12760 [Saccharothrix mutabilis subsp. capreolus]